MHALLVLALAAYLLAPEVRSFRVEYELGRCDPRRQKKSSPEVCTAVATADGDVGFLNCALHLRGRGHECAGEGSRRYNLKMDPPRKKNITLYLDNNFGLLFENPGWLSGGYNGRIKCSTTTTMSYKETPGEKCGEHPHLLSRKFRGLQKSNGLPTEFEVVDSVPIGSVIVDENCIQCEEGKPPTCRIRAKMQWKANMQDHGVLSFIGKLIDASIENKLIMNYSQALEISPLQFETKELSKIYNVNRNTIVYNTANRWAAIFSVMSHFKDINAISISGSPIQYFGTSILMGMHQLRELTASSCSIRMIDEGSLKDNTFLTRIDLSKNEIHTLQSNLFKDLKHLTYLDLSHNKFTHGQGFDFHLHSEWPDCGMQLLDMSSNALERAANMIGFKSRVKHINLADNLLKDLSSITTGGWIKELNLSGNRIATLSQSSLETLDMIEYVILTNNLFDCGSCNLLDMQNWFNSTGRKILSSPPEDLICSTPSHLRQQKKKVLEVEYDVGSCFDHYHAKPVTVETLNQSILVLSVTLIITLITVTLTIYQQEVFQSMGNIIKNTISRRNKECIYDASISYSANDESWVLHDLLPALEDGEQKYKLFLNDRELILGKVMKKYIKESLARCRKSIVILSKDFVNCQYKNWEGAERMIFNKHQKKLILIAREEPNRDEVPQNLNSLINEVTYLEWPKRSSVSIPETMDPLVSGDSVIEKNIGPGKTDISYESLLETYWKDLFKALGTSIFIEASLRKNAEFQQESDDESVENDRLSIEKEDTTHEET